jgi:hypothetical protein
MINQVEKLITQIDSYLDGKISPEDLEQFTLSLISEDQFNTLSTEIQDAIYALDSKELNTLSDTDLEMLRDELTELIKASK